MRQFKWLGTNRLSQVLKDWVQNDGGYETIGSLYCTTYDFSPELSFENWFVSRKWLHLQWILWHFVFSLYFKSCSVVNYSQLKVFIASKFNFFFCGIASYTIRIFYVQETGDWGRILHILVGKTDLLLLNLFEIPRCHKTCRLQTETKERFVWLIWSSVLLRCHQKMTISRRWLRRNVNLGRNEKLGSLEISIFRKFASPMSFGS